MQSGHDSTHRRMLEHVVRFSRALHAGGVPVNSASLVDFCRCCRYIDMGRRDDFYAAARATLVSHHDDLAPFDRVFRQYWEHLVILPGHGTDEPAAEPGNTDADQRKAGTLMAPTPDDTRGSTAGDDAVTAYSAEEVLMKRDLGAMTEQEIEAARRLIAPLVALFANSQSRRLRRSRRGEQLDFRRMLRRQVMQGVDDVRLLHRRRRIKKTRLMLLCDVSGSMARYSRFLILFIYALQRQVGNLEVAVFATRMTPITELLRGRSVEDSLVRVAAFVQDWAGGTNIGASIREFNERYTAQMRRSRTVMLVLSDGWDRGDPTVMRREMAHLQRCADKLIWLNPLLGHSEYQPLTQGMQAALPFLDHFLPADNLASLARLAHLLRQV
jgi:uncharacterized protein with von Willebrand factor type A (vWA) domain